MKRESELYNMVEQASDERKEHKERSIDQGLATSTSKGGGEEEDEARELLRRDATKSR